MQYAEWQISVREVIHLMCIRDVRRKSDNRPDAVVLFTRSRPHAEGRAVGSPVRKLTDITKLMQPAGSRAMPSVGSRSLGFYAGTG